MLSIRSLSIICIIVTYNDIAKRAHTFRQRDINVPDQCLSIKVPICPLLGNAGLFRITEVMFLICPILTFVAIMLVRNRIFYFLFSA